MRVCRFEVDGDVQAGFYADEYIVPVKAAAEAYAAATGESLDLPDSSCLLRLLPGGEAETQAKQLADWAVGPGADALFAVRKDFADLKLLKPIPRPDKLFLLAGNYAKHIEEGGGIAAERAETFPYVFMKPASTTLNDPGCPVTIPQNSPDHIDWELELAIVIGKTAKCVSEAEALDYVAGFTVVNDISNRKYRPNPGRTKRERDGFFDWLHGKWHDSFCPCGPCVATLDAVGDPQDLAMQLSVNGALKQDASTSQMVFPAAAVVEFVSNIVTLERGDIISTGTPAGVGAARGEFLKAGDMLDARIEKIGVLRSPVVDA